MPACNPPRSGERRSVARIGGLGDGPGLPALCDDNVGGRRLDHSLNLRTLMPGQHQKPSRMGADLLVLSRRQLDRALAVQPRALAAIGGPLTVLARPLAALDGFIDPTSKALIRGHELFAITVHTLILSKRLLEGAIESDLEARRAWDKLRLPGAEPAGLLLCRRASSAEASLSVAAGSPLGTAASAVESTPATRSDRLRERQHGRRSTR
jgi:hypothetical protein